MNKTEFIKFAEESNAGFESGVEEIDNRCALKIKSANSRVLEIASFIKENSPLKMRFYICLDKRFAKYDRSWANIFLPEQGISIFVVDNQFDRDIIFQLYGKRYMLIFDNDDSMDFIGSEITRKIIEVSNEPSGYQAKIKNLEKEAKSINDKINRIKKYNGV